jgi:hypothetical protein
MDLDPRDFDSRDDRFDIERRRDDDRNSLRDIGPDDDARRPDDRLLDRDDGEGGSRSAHEDPRWPDSHFW